jgi:hypothetical protein
MPASTNKFVEQTAQDIIIAENTPASQKVGELRIKPSSILWKARGAQQYRSVTLEAFSAWITANGKLVNK